MKAGTTLRVRGEGGAEWDQDVPDEGTTQRELLDDLIAKGRVIVLHDPDADDEPAGQDDAPPAPGPADGTIDDVIARVWGGPLEDPAADGWRERATAALDAEKAKGDKARTRLVARLEEIATTPTPPEA